MKSLEFHLVVLEDIQRRLGVSLERDMETLVRRFNAEGHHFTEVILPDLEKTLLQGLELGMLPRNLEFGCDAGDRPFFLGGLWCLIFDGDGLLLPNPSAVAIQAIRQICLLQKKIFEVCADEEKETAVESFIAVDAAMGDLRFDETLIDELSEIAMAVFGRAIKSVDWDSIVPSHGPGAVSERLTGASKWRFPNTAAEIEDRWPGITNPLYRSEPCPTKAMLTKPEGPPRSRLVAVPKTRVKPRLIAIEPVAAQFVQQGIKDELMRILNRFPSCSLSDQGLNQDLARRASVDRSHSTIDLSEASDRVSLRLVEKIFSKAPSFLSAVLACRTRLCEVETPTGTRLVELNKFASMGNALTFPIEVMVFTSIVLQAILHDRGLDVRSARGLAYSDEVRVYGDDIIVPVEHTENVMSLLTAYGLKVNREKTFTAGNFRESCGGDFYGGVDVSPIYGRRRIPSSWRDTQEIVSLVAFANLYRDHYGPNVVTEWVVDHCGSFGLVLPRREGALTKGYLAVEGLPSPPYRERREYGPGTMYRDTCVVPVLKLAAGKERPSRGDERLLYSLSRVQGSVVVEPGRLDGKILLPSEVRDVEPDIYIKLARVQSD